MPIYEYQCQQCGHRLDVLQKHHEAPAKKCPKCGQSSLNKLISAPRFQLKGTGWYVTDFKNSGQSKAEAKPDASSEGSQDSAEQSQTNTAQGQPGGGSADTPAKANTKSGDSGTQPQSAKPSAETKTDERR